MAKKNTKTEKVLKEEEEKDFKLPVPDFLHPKADVEKRELKARAENSTQAGNDENLKSSLLGPLMFGFRCRGASLIHLTRG